MPAVNRVMGLCQDYKMAMSPCLFSSSGALRLVTGWGDHLTADSDINTHQYGIRPRPKGPFIGEGYQTALKAHLGYICVFHDTS